MKIFNEKWITAIIALAICVSTLLACSKFSGGNSSSDSKSGTGWKVWVKTSPCSGGRADWITVARENPTVGGGGFWQTADLILNPQACTLISDDSCTFSQADASANIIRASGKFSSYCCRDWSVWRNTASGEMSIFKGSGSAGFGWQFVSGSMCCEKAEAMTGKTGLCAAAPPLGPVASRTPVINPTIRQNTNTAASNDGDGDNYNSYPSHNSAPTQRTPAPIVSGRWVLESVTAIPEQRSGWTYNAQSSSARYDIYNGDRHDFQWTKPPPRIDENGFTVSISTQCTSQPNNRCASLIGVSGDGLTSDMPAGERIADANGENGATGSKQKSVTFKPSLNSDEIRVEIGLEWGDVRFIYKYRRAE